MIEEPAKLQNKLLPHNSVFEIATFAKFQNQILSRDFSFYYIVVRRLQNPNPITLALVLNQTLTQT